MNRPFEGHWDSKGNSIHSIAVTNDCSGKLIVIPNVITSLLSLGVGVELSHVCCCTGHVGLFTRHFVLIPGGTREERLQERES